MTQQYREVKRKAAVGERIKVVNAWLTGGLYKNGDVFIVTETHAEHEGAVIGVAERLSAVGIVVGEYVVLEPVTESIAPSPLSSDPLYAAFRQFVADNADGIRAILPELEAARTDGHYEITAERGLKFVPTLTRAQVIAKATADVAELLDRNYPLSLGYSPSVYFSSKDGYFVTNECNFVVNREKRTVVALISIINSRDPERKGIAKCSPADVFHAEIGKAIALRKALGLTVPNEYTDAPQPEKALNYAKVTYANKRYTITPGDFKEGTHGTNEATASSPVAREGKITDDTDVDYSAVSAKGVAA